MNEDASNLSIGSVRTLQFIRQELIENEKEIQRLTALLNSTPNDAVSDTTGDATGNGTMAKKNSPATQTEDFACMHHDITGDRKCMVQCYSCKGQQPTPPKAEQTTEDEDLEDKESEETTDRNAHLIAEFIELLKKDFNINIPDKAFEQFFNA